MASRPIPQVRPELRQFSAYGARPAGPGAARLNANEWPDATPASAYLSAEDLDRLMLNRYPGPAEVRGLLAARYGVEPDQLMFGNGSNDTIMQLFLVFGGHGRTTLLFQPTYNLHGRFTVIAGGTLANEIVGLPYHLTRERALEAAARVRPDIVSFCTPNNPTGTLVDDGVILAVAERHPGTLVLVDEAYADIPGRTLLPALADHPNLVISKTFSKVHAAAGLRFGILVMGRELAEAVRVVVPPINVSVVTYALAAKIARDEGTVRARIAKVRTERERVFAALGRVGGIEAFPSEANFILFRIEGDTTAMQERFLEAGVAIRDMAPWTGCDGCLRVSIGTREENDRFLAAAATIFARTPA